MISTSGGPPKSAEEISHDSTQISRTKTYSPPQSDATAADRHVLTLSLTVVFVGRDRKPGCEDS